MRRFFTTLTALAKGVRTERDRSTRGGRPDRPRSRGRREYRTKGNVDEAARRLREVRRRAERIGGDGSVPVPDHGVVCDDDGPGYLFATADDVEVDKIDDVHYTKVYSGEWLHTEAAVDVEGWC